MIEFAVNDEGDETKGDCYESLVRKVLNLPWKPAVVLLFSVFANDWNLQERLKPVGYRYDLPMVSIRDAVSPQFQMPKGRGRVLTKNQIFYDMFHPNNMGHTIMADCLQYLFEQCDLRNQCGVETLERQMKAEERLKECMSEPPAIGKSFETVRLLDRKDGYRGAEIDEGGFTAVDRELQSVEMDAELTPVPQFPYNWMYDGTNSDKNYFEMTITCRSLLLVFKDSGEIYTGKAEISVDGGYCMTADPHINNWLHCNAVILFQEEESKKHIVRITIPEEDRNKQFTILGFGYVQ